jgi:hypothetical protein
MRRIPLRRPSPALIVATIALFLAAGGTGYALTLPANSVGAPQIKPGQVLNSKLATNSVTYSKLATNQMTTVKIRNRSLLGEDLANNTITGQQVDESTLKLPTPPAPPVTKFALVSGGTIGAQSGGISVAQAGPPVILDFGSTQAGRPIAATLASTATDATGQISAAPCGGASASNPNGVICPPAVNDPNHVVVQTADSTGAPKALPFSISILQG